MRPAASAALHDATTSRCGHFPLGIAYGDTQDKLISAGSRGWPPSRLAGILKHTLRFADSGNKAPSGLIVGLESIPQTGGHHATRRIEIFLTVGGNPGKDRLGLDFPSIPEALHRIIGVQSLFGKAVRDRVSETDVWVLDVQGRSGSARVDLGPWTAFIHLAAHQHQWAIANVLWEWRS